MSEPLRVAFVVEGKTDYVVLVAVVEEILAEREVVPTPLKPELSEAFEAISTELGEGWAGSYRWCRQATEQAGGRLRDNLLYRFHDVLVVALDADVADATYSDGHIDDPTGDLPCRRPCPPPRATVDALRAVMLRWMGEQSMPSQTALCTPSKALETWLLVGLYPGHRETKRLLRVGTIECRDQPALLLQGMPAQGRLVRSGKKDSEQYRTRAADIAAAWDSVRAACTEAERFHRDVLALVT